MNGAAYGAGYEGQALSLDAALNAHVRVPGLDINSTNMSAITFGAWVNADFSPNAIRGVLSHDNGGYDRTRGIDFRGGSPGWGWSAFRGNGIVHGAPVVPGQWAFLAVRHDQATGAYASMSTACRSISVT